MGGRWGNGWWWGAGDTHIVAHRLDVLDPLPPLLWVLAHRILAGRHRALRLRSGDHYPFGNGDKALCHPVADAVILDLDPEEMFLHGRELLQQLAICPLQTGQPLLDVPRDSSQIH